MILDPARLDDDLWLLSLAPMTAKSMVHLGRLFFSGYNSMGIQQFVFGLNSAVV
ncbi:MAG TPA: hypothetical protein VIB79_10720 [Candidatus Binatia bacterium]|jgi:hypothetical protein